LPGDGIAGYSFAGSGGRPNLLWKPHGESLMSINNVNNLGSSSPVQKILSNPIQKQIPADAPAQLPAGDKLELSGMSNLLKTLKANDIRTDKVATIKAAIASGTYEDDHKLDVATDRLLDDLLK
jgi:flagellar biosynthesis anti-sigma factor FlgM